MKRFIFAFPGDLSTPTGGYIYDRQILKELTRSGWHVQLLGLGDGFPFPSESTVASARQRLLDLPAGIPIVMDGLALGVLPQVVAEISVRNPVVAMIHHPLAYEAGLSFEQADTLKVSETEALSHVAFVIANSQSTARDLTQSFNVNPDSIEIVLPGTVRAPLAQGSGVCAGATPAPLRLLAVGSIIPRKGFDILMAALHPLTELAWTLSIAGDATRDAVAPLQLYKDIARFGFENRVYVLGAVDDTQLEILYQQADIFVLASLFEGYGMAYAEALARGLPVIGTTGGAIPDTVPLGAGLLVPPGDVQSLTTALKTLIEDAECRARLSQGARQAAASQPTWEDSAKIFSSVLLRFTT